MTQQCPGYGVRSGSVFFEIVALERGSVTSQNLARNVMGWIGGQ